MLRARVASAQGHSVSRRPLCLSPAAPTRLFSTSLKRLEAEAASPPPPPPLGKRALSIAFTSLRYAGYVFGSVGFGIFTITAVVFIHDAFTYSSKHIDRVPVSPLALHPEVGGPKNLPIARVLMGDDQVRRAVTNLV